MRKILFILFILHLPATVHLFSAKPVTVTASFNQMPVSLDPAHSWDDASTLFTYNIFDTLVEINPGKRQPEASLAVSWQVKDNGAQWIFQLRQGVKFQDGCPFNADAVVFSFQRQLDKKFKYRYYDFVLFREIFPYLKSVKKIDDYQVAFYLSEPFYPFLASLTSGSAAIVSPRAVKRYGKEFPNHPIGTGPFKLNSWQKKSRIVLEKNDSYWREKPHIDRFSVIFQTDTRPAHRLFKEQKLDIIFNFSISRTMGLKLLHWVKVHHSTLMSSNFIALNFKNKYLKKKNIRNALVSLWDPRYLKFVFQEYISPSASFVPPGVMGYEKDMPARVFSLQKARAYLKKEKIDKPIQFTFVLHKGRELDAEVFRLYANNLRKAGIHLKIIQLDNAQYFKEISQGNFDLTYTGWIADYPDAHSMIFPMFSKLLQDDGLANLSSYEETDVLTSINKAAVEPDAHVREKIYIEINRLINSEILCIPISHNTKDFLYNKAKLRNIKVNSVGMFNLRLIKKK